MDPALRGIWEKIGALFVVHAAGSAVDALRPDPQLVALRGCRSAVQHRYLHQEEQNLENFLPAPFQIWLVRPAALIWRMTWRK